MGPPALQVHVVGVAMSISPGLMLADVINSHSLSNSTRTAIIKESNIKHQSIVCYMIYTWFIRDGVITLR